MAMNYLIAPKSMKLDNGEKTLLSEAVLKELEVGPNSAARVLTTFAAKGVETWGNLMDVKTEGKMIENAGNEANGTTIWRKLEEYRNRRSLEKVLFVDYGLSIPDEALTSLKNKGIQTWGNLLAVKTEEKMIEYAGHEISGGTIWNAIEAYKEKKELVLQSRFRTASQSTEPSKRQRLLKKTAHGSKELFFRDLCKAELLSDQMRLKTELFRVGDELIYLREVDKRLFNMIKPKILAGDVIVITGTPGIGKSMFGYHAAYALVSENITVIHIHDGWNSCNLYVPKEPHPQVVEVLKKYNFEDLSGWAGRFQINADDKLSDDASELYKDLVTISGGVVVNVDPPSDWTSRSFAADNCGVLVVASPNPSRTKFARLNLEHTQFYMPTWTPTETKALLRARKGSSLTEQEELECDVRFAQFGGVLRIIARVNSSHAEMMAKGKEAVNTALKSLRDDSSADFKSDRINASCSRGNCSHTG